MSRKKRNEEPKAKRVRNRSKKAVQESKPAPKAQPKPAPKAQPKPAPKAVKPKSKDPDRRHGGTHPVHPRCTKCARPMYKTPNKGEIVKPTDPWGFCRNSECEQFNVDQSGESRFAPVGGKKKAPKAKAKVKATAEEAEEEEAAAAEEAEPGPAEEGEEAEEVLPEEEPEPEAEAEEPEPEAEEALPEEEPVPEEEAGELTDEQQKILDEAKTRLASAVKKRGKFSHNVCSVVLSQVSSELSPEYANQLIEEYKLQELFGIEPIGV